MPCADQAALFLGPFPRRRSATAAARSQTADRRPVADCARDLDTPLIFFYVLQTDAHPTDLIGPSIKRTPDPDNTIAVTMTEFKQRVALRETLLRIECPSRRATASRLPRQIHPADPYGSAGKPIRPHRAADWVRLSIAAQALISRPIARLLGQSTDGEHRHGGCWTIGVHPRPESYTGKSDGTSIWHR